MNRLLSLWSIPWTFAARHEGVSRRSAPDRRLVARRELDPHQAQGASVGRADLIPAPRNPKYWGWQTTSRLTWRPILALMTSSYSTPECGFLLAPDRRRGSSGSRSPERCGDIRWFLFSPCRRVSSATLIWLSKRPNSVGHSCVFKFLNFLSTACSCNGETSRSRGTCRACWCARP